MSRSWWLRTGLLVFLVIFSCIALVPTVVEMALYPEAADDIDKEVSETDVRNPPLPSWYTSLPDWTKAKQLSLGLDLQGGLMLRYSVDVDSALADKMRANAANIRSLLAEEKGIATSYVFDQNALEITFKFQNAADVNIMNDKFIKSINSDLRTIAASGDEVKVGWIPGYKQEQEQYAIQQAVEIIRERIDGLGVAQPTVRVEQGNQIAIELPGLSRSRVDAAEKLISTTAVLTFKLVADRNESLAVFTNLSQKITENSGIYIGGGMIRADDVIDANTGRIITSGKDILKAFARANEMDIPSGREIVYEKVDLRERKMEVAEDVDLTKLPTSWRMRLVRTDLPALGGENVDAAYPATNPDTNMPYVSLKLNRVGGDIFHNLTKEHVGDQLAILMDDQLVSDPVIRSEIPGGNVSIEMGRGNRQETMTEVNNLVVSLRSGALPAPIRQEHKTLVGASLGQDAIESGMKSLAIGFALVFVFMAIYYRGSGVIAAFALFCNVLFIMAGMATMGASLTMPGIAGIVLTVGMSVDANVIIFERIREELRNNESPRKAILIGYDKALWTILDSNITTAVAAIVLMNFGSGPVKGFAVTLLLGLISTVYTAFFVTRTIFEIKVRRNSESLSI
ncbi:MAG: protein translocase subunit SecD [Proteobacteria bacterium]|nr:protein translocase subunit SecD [Pseudomonadota bacterium]